MLSPNRKTKDHIRSVVYANKNLVQNFLAGVLTTVQYDNTVFDLLLEYNTAGAWQFIPIRAGYYLIAASLGINTVGVARINIFTIYVDAAPRAIQRKELSAANAETYQIWCVAYLTPNNNVTVRFQADPLAAMTNTVAGGECQLSICRLD